MVAYTAAYYGRSPLEVEQWKTSQVYKWFDEACKLEEMKEKAMKKALENNG